MLRLIKNLPNDIGDIDVESIIMNMLEGHFQKVSRLLERIGKTIKDDPLMVIANTDVEFGDLLKEYPGKLRSSIAFKKKFDVLSAKNVKYKKMAENFDLVKFMEIENKLKLYSHTLEGELNMMLYRRKMRKKIVQDSSAKKVFELLDSYKV